jgi:hypothetical protein
MPRKSAPSVASFGPELLAALLRGAVETLVVRLPDFDTAFALRQRFYALRAAMKRESHPQTSVVYRASMALPTKEPDGSSVLTLKPSDEVFVAALRAAGVNGEDLRPPAILLVEPAVEFTEHELPKDYIDSLLKDV